MPTPLTIVGCDFTSRHSRRKPITLAWGQLRGATLYLDRIDTCSDTASFTQALAQPHWIGGFDMPFGLPAELISHLGWPLQWLECMRHYASLSRATIRLEFKAFCDARPVGRKFAHRATDIPAGSSPSMKWVNPPVAYMLHAGVPLLLDANVSLAGLHLADPHRIALEAYPALAARPIIGKQSYKSDDPHKQTTARHETRSYLVKALSQTPHPHLALKLSASQALLKRMVDDASGDSLDAVLCAMQAAWASQQTNYGLPNPMPPLEGWIITAKHNKP